MQSIRPIARVFALSALIALAGCDRGSGEEAQDGREGPSVGRNANGIDEPRGGWRDGAAIGEVSRDFVGSPLPALRFSDPDGDTLDLAGVDGPVLVNLWATWCAPCVVEMPMLDTLAAQVDDVRVITISQDYRAAEVVAPFFETRDFEHLEPWLDPEAELTARLSDNGQLPVSVLYDADGREVFRVVGAYEWDSEEAVALVQEAVRDGT